MGLVAREIESRGVPTLALSSALSITRSVGTPRAAFLDYPLGRTAGKPGDRAEQKSILAEALGLFESLDAPGSIVPLPFEWSDNDSWKQSRDSSTSGEEEGAGGDARTARDRTPQYQDERDQRLAEEALASIGCATCIFPD